MEENQSIRPVLAGPAVARRGVLTVHTAGGQLVVRASPRYVDAVAEWCDGLRDVDGIAAMSRAKWGSTDFPRFLTSLLGAGVLVDPAVAALRAMQPSTELGRAPRQPGFATGVMASECGKLTEDQLVELASLLETVRSRPRAECAGGAFLGLTLLLLRRVGAFGEGVYRVGSAMNMQRIGDVGPVIWHAMTDPLAMARWPVLLLVSARVRHAGIRASRSAMLEAGAVAYLAELWASKEDRAWAGDLACDEDRLLAACGLGEECLVYAAALGARRAVEERGRTPEVTWADLPEHRGLAIARAAPPTAPGSRPEFVAWGRAYEPKQALAKALGEYAERKALREPAQVVEARIAELPGAVDPEAFVRYSRQQLARAFPRLKGFDPEETQRWVQGREWRTGASVWLPADCVHGADALSAQGADSFLARPTSSGCASDVDLDTAIERAAYELIERDAFARHWLAQAPVDRISPGTLPGRIQDRMEVLQAQGCESFVLRMAKGLGPAILVLIRHAERGFVCAGSACGAELASSIERAFIEAEAAAVVRCVTAARAKAVHPRQAVSPEDHANLHARRGYFRRADVLLGPGADSVPASAISWPESLEERLATGTSPRPVYWVELSSADAPCQLDGRPIRTVRVLVPDCIPLAFGFGALPEGMVAHRVHAAARFPHPLP